MWIETGRTKDIIVYCSDVEGMEKEMKVHQRIYNGVGKELAPMPIWLGTAKFPDLLRQALDLFERMEETDTGSQVPASSVGGKVV